MFLILVIIIIIITNIDFTISQHDITYGLRMEYCDNEKVKALKDGDRRTAHTFQNSSCPLSFDLQPVTRNFHLNYMVIFTGEVGKVSTRDHYLDNLIHLSECSKIPTRIHLIKQMEKGVRINQLSISCRLLFSTKLTDITLAEIVMYGHELPYGLHRGCFSNVFDDIIYLHDYESFTNCYTSCYPTHLNRYNVSFTIAISQPLGECICLGNINYDNEVPLSKCDTKCDGTNRSCGGSDAHSVYILSYRLPVFLGCFNKTAFYLRRLPDEILEVKIKDLTFSKCMRFCERYHYIWFMDDICACSKRSIFGLNSDSSLCDIPCAFDEEITCGGRLAISVYHVCMMHGESAFCPKLLNCKRGVFNHYGVCIYGCKSGFGGEHCIERVSDPIPGEIEEPDEEIEVLSSISLTEDYQIRITIKSKSVGVMADYSFSILVAAAIF